MRKKKDMDLKQDYKMQFADLIVMCVLFAISCIAGRLALSYICESWFAFNGTTLGVMAIGFILRRYLKKV